MTHPQSPVPAIVIPWHFEGYQVVKVFMADGIDGQTRQAVAAKLSTVPTLDTLSLLENYVTSIGVDHGLRVEVLRGGGHADPLHQSVSVAYFLSN